MEKMRTEAIFRNSPRGLCIRILWGDPAGCGLRSAADQPPRRFFASLKSQPFDLLWKSGMQNGRERDERKILCSGSEGGSLAAVEFAEEC